MIKLLRLRLIGSGLGGVGISRDCKTDRCRCVQDAPSSRGLASINLVMLPHGRRQRWGSTDDRIGKPGNQFDEVGLPARTGLAEQAVQMRFNRCFADTQCLRCLTHTADLDDRKTRALGRRQSGQVSAIASCGKGSSSATLCTSSVGIARPERCEPRRAAARKGAMQCRRRSPAAVPPFIALAANRRACNLRDDPLRARAEPPHRRPACRPPRAGRSACAGPICPLALALALTMRPSPRPGTARRQGIKGVGKCGGLPECPSPCSLPARGRTCRRARTPVFDILPPPGGEGPAAFPVSRARDPCGSP